MATRKHLDLPLDDDVNIFNKGITGKSLLGLGGLALAGVLGWHAIDKTMAPPVQPDISAPVLAAPQEYEVRFWAEDGGEIEVIPSSGE